MYTASEDLAAFVQSLPKTETHLHLEGACPFPLLQKADPVKYQNPPPMWDDSFRYKSFSEFKDVYDEYCSSIFVDAQAYHVCASVVLKACYDQNCKYVETSFHVGALVGGNVTGPEVLKAIHDAAPSGLEVRVYMGMCHDDYHGKTKDLIDDCIHWEQLHGIDLHGPEDLPMEPWTEQVWARAAAAGKRLKAHAGEFMPAWFVRWCVEKLGVKRIQHGVRGVEDPAVVQMLIDDGVHLDMCPISNLKLQVAGVPTMADHPIRKLFDAGVTCTISSDDPLMFGNTLSEEYYALATDLRFSKAELAQLALNGFKIADWVSEDRLKYIAELEAIIARFS